MDRANPQPPHELSWLDRLNLRLPAWARILVRASRSTLQPDTTITAAAIAYFALFSIFPILLLSISVGTFYLGPDVAAQMIVQRMEFIAPALGRLLGRTIDEIVRTRGPLTGGALLGLIWSASAVFYVLTQTMYRIWKKKRVRPGWKRRGLSILFVLAFVGPLLFLVSFASSIISSLITWWPSLNAVIVDSLSFVLAIVLNIALFTLLYFLLPHGGISWRGVLPGSVAAGLLWEMAKKAFLFIVSYYVSASNLVYGSVSALAAFLIWAHLSGTIFVFGAYINVAYLEHQQSELEALAQPRPEVD
jgi:membrane protein